mgnify:FL=1
MKESDDKYTTALQMLNNSRKRYKLFIQKLKFLKMLIKNRLLRLNKKLLNWRNLFWINGWLIQQEDLLVKEW